MLGFRTAILGQDLL